MKSGNLFKLQLIEKNKYYQLSSRKYYLLKQNVMNNNLLVSIRTIILNLNNNIYT